MPQINEDMRAVAEKTPTWALATNSKKGVPNVVCIGLGKFLFENQILLVDVFMNKTRANIEENPYIAVAIWDMESGKGYQFKGHAKFESTGLNFEECVRIAKAFSEDIEPKSALIITVEEIFEITPGPNAGVKLK